MSAGPGINDNGSGSAAILEVAEQMGKVRPRNTVRFAWWGADESGLVGSTFYVDSLDDAQRADVGLYLNFDMVGSPNYVRFVYGGTAGEPHDPCYHQACDTYGNVDTGVLDLNSEPSPRPRCTTR